MTLKQKNILLWILKIVASVILLQTLFYKFSASKESVYIFTAIGLEPVGRIGIGILELITAILLFIPRLSWVGALLGVGIMVGALFFHLTKLGIVVMDDNGLLFTYSLIVTICCAVIAYLNKDEIINFINKTGIVKLKSKMQ